MLILWSVLVRIGIVSLFIIFGASLAFASGLSTDAVVFTALGGGLLALVAVLVESFFHLPKGSRGVIAFIGLISGSILGLGIGIPLYLLSTPSAIGPILMLVSVASFAYAGVSVGLSYRGGFSNPSSSPTPEQNVVEHRTSDVKKLLDTSVIIDGRVIDVARTGFLEGILVVPRFVLHELQQVADSGDALKRSRGRRGLDILNQLKSSKSARIWIMDVDYEVVEGGVDSKLLLMAKDIDAVVVTNDYNLSKVAGIQGVKVLNINDLAHALRPIVSANDELRVSIVKVGKDQHQGIAYLEDGTMVVVDNGHERLGEDVTVTVTSVLQNESGRMIFSKFTGGRPPSRGGWRPSSSNNDNNDSSYPPRRRPFTPRSRSSGHHSSGGGNFSGKNS